MVTVSPSMLTDELSALEPPSDKTMSSAAEAVSEQPENASPPAARQTDNPTTVKKFFPYFIYI